MARCPNCTETLHRSADGQYPERCPKCGARLKAKSKTSVPARVAAKPPTAEISGEERVIRSFSSRRPPVSAPTQPAASPLPEPMFDETPAAESFDTPAPPSAEPTPAVNPFPTASDQNPFAPPSAKPATLTMVAPEEANPFGASAVAAPSVRTPRTGLIKGVIAGLLIAAIASVGVYFGKDLLKGPAPKERPGFQNPGRHYVFYTLPAPWKTDEGRAKRAGYELVLHRADLNGWVTIRTDIAKDNAVDPRDVAEEAAAKWKDRIPDFKPAEQLGKMKLGGQDAVVVEGEGTLDGKPTRGRTLVLVADGIKYVMAFEAPVDEWDKLERDFTLARDSLEISAGAIAPVKTLGENDVAVFESKKFPYRLSTPARTWREVPDLQTDSRFDDLKLQDKPRLGEIVVQARETKDLPGMRVRYVEAKSRLYDKKVREVESAVEKLKIRNRDAMRTLLIVSNAGGDFMLFTSFVKGDGLIFQVQCRAPLDKRDVYEPLFAKITDSFEVLDRPPAPPEPEKKEPPTDKQPAPDLKKMALDAALPKPSADDMKKPSTDMAKPKPASTAEKNPTEPKKDAKKKDDKKPDSKKKKSLDDLD